ncbi:hypothetical protein [Dyella nitratireducens]|uniref:hypothetical protein n=1 Tax=Dyella nitratireducens TaxID=1849580 RepID=UPI0016696DA5|nr:hypothetical protein [Dyella nitratireducens]
MITGASSGIGEAIANRLAKAGYTAFGTTRRLTPSGKRLFEMLPLDVTSDADLHPQLYWMRGFEKTCSSNHKQAPPAR